MADKREPSKEQIERRAYELYIERGAQPGQELTDWFAAEQELTQMAQPMSAETSKREVTAA